MSAQTKGLIAALIALVTLALTLGCRGSVDEQIRALQSDVARRLPSNCGYADVLAYLDRNGIQHTEYREAQSAEEQTLLGAPGRVDGVLRKVETTVVSTTDIRLTFLFNKQGRMLSYKISESVKAP